MAEQFERADRRHLGRAEAFTCRDINYSEFLNLAYQHEHLKREHLWMAFRYLVEPGDD